MNKIAIVSEDTRRSGRVAPDVHLERLDTERESLVLEKKRIEVKLSEIDSWKASETASILKKRLSKTLAIHATTSLEANVRKQKAPLIREKQAIEERLQSIKTTIKNKNRSMYTNPSADILLRIETILVEILNTMKERP